MNRYPVTVSIGLGHQSSKEFEIISTILDSVFFLCLVGIQSNFFGMLNPEWLYWPGLFDNRMLLLIACTLISVMMISRWYFLLKAPAGRWLIIITAYVGVQFIFSSMQYGWFDAFKVFRYYCLPIVAIGPLLYVLSLSRKRQLRLVRWVFVATVVQGIFYILHHKGFSIFYSPVHEVAYFDGGEVQRYNHAFPPYTVLVMNASLLFFLFQRRLHYVLYLLILAGVVILYATRVVIVHAVFSIMLILTLTMFKKGVKTIARIGIIIFFVIMGSAAFTMIFPQYLGFVAERFQQLTGPKGIRGDFNYSIRMLMVEIAVYDMATVKDMLFGHGYGTRPLYKYSRGDIFTDLSMQGDAPIAGLLFTEGILGVFLRALPFLILLLVHLRLFLKAKNAEDIIISALVIVMISGIGLTWLQTTALRDLPFSLLPYVMLHRLHIATDTNRRMQREKSAMRRRLPCPRPFTVNIYEN